MSFCAYSYSSGRLMIPPHEFILLVLKLNENCFSKGKYKHEIVVNSES